MDIEKLIADGIIVVKEHYEDRVDKDMITGEEKPVRSYYKKYYDTRKFIKTFNPVIDKLIKDFEGVPKAQMIFMLMSMLEDNKEVVDIDFGYKEFSKVCKKHEVKMWTRSQLSNYLRWLADKEYISKIDGSVYRINYKYLYNGSLLKPLGLAKSIECIEVCEDNV